MGGGLGGAFARGGGGSGRVWGGVPPKAKRWSIKSTPYLPLPSL